MLHKHKRQIQMFVDSNAYFAMRGALSYQGIDNRARPLLISVLQRAQLLEGDNYPKKHKVGVARQRIPSVERREPETRGDASHDLEDCSPDLRAYVGVRSSIEWPSDDDADDDETEIPVPRNRYTALSV